MQHPMAQGLVAAHFPACHGLGVIDPGVGQGVGSRSHSCAAIHPLDPWDVI